MFAVMNATAIFLQRVWRGYLGRVATMQRRIEMAHFIALMRSQEAEDDEFIYWENHPWAKFKRRMGSWVNEKIGVPENRALADPLDRHIKTNL
jgi:hypothetical protein